MRDASIILVTYLILGIRKTVSPNVLNLVHKAEDYNEMILTLTYLCSCLVLLIKLKQLFFTFLFNSVL
jgi:hypothetical protein